MTKKNITPEEQAKNIFRTMAQDATVLCKLQSGREKMETEDLVGKELTIIAFDFAPKFDKDGVKILDENGEADMYAVVVFAEYPQGYYNAGLVLTKVARTWAEAFDGDVDTASEQLQEMGGVPVKFTMGKTKSGKNLVTVEII